MNPSFFRAVLRNLVLAAALLASGGALAHVALVSSTPAADSHVPSAEYIDLTFNQAVLPRASRITVSRVNADKSLTEVENVDITLVDGNKTMRATPRQALPPGNYRVEWRAVGSDQHPMTGGFVFMVH